MHCIGGFHGLALRVISGKSVLFSAEQRPFETLNDRWDSNVHPSMHDPSKFLFL